MSIETGSHKSLAEQFNQATPEQQEAVNAGLDSKQKDKFEAIRSFEGAEASANEFNQRVKKAIESGKAIATSNDIESIRAKLRADGVEQQKGKAQRLDKAA